MLRSGQLTKTLHENYKNWAELGLILHRCVLIVECRKIDFSIKTYADALSAALSLHKRVLKLG